MENIEKRMRPQKRLMRGRSTYYLLLLFFFFGGGGSLTKVDRWYKCSNIASGLLFDPSRDVFEKDSAGVETPGHYLFLFQK